MGFEFSRLPHYLIQYAVLVFSLTVHECAHAWTAYKLGDPTAKLKGRITLNPLVHLDPIGSVIFPILAIFMGIPVIGWANPVPVNPMNLRNPRRDHAIVAALGPGSNMMYALGFALLAHLFIAIGGGYSPLNDGVQRYNTVIQPILFILIYGVLINLILALFNMIPVPPLDGSWILEGLVPESAAQKLAAIRPYGFLILLVLFYTGIFSYFLMPFLGLFYSVIFRLPAFRWMF
ncbi:site-2 protease family protein [Acidobacteriota bacterium]